MSFTRRKYMYRSKQNEPASHPSPVRDRRRQRSAALLSASEASAEWDLDLAIRQ